MMDELRGSYAEAISRFGVTTLWLTAGLFHLMVDHRLTGLAPLRQLIAGGDVLSPSHIAKAQAALPAEAVARLTEAGRKLTIKEALDLARTPETAAA